MSVTRNSVYRRGDERGQAMLLVLVAMALLTSIPLAIVMSTAGQLPLTTSHLVWNAAYEAADAGLNDYLQHLDANEAYTQYSASAEPSPANPAFTSWVQVSGSSDPALCYEYAPTVLSGSQAGLISLTVSGKATDNQAPSAGSTFTATGGASGGDTVTAASGTFSSADVGQLIFGTGVPSNTSITAVSGSTQITLSQDLTASASGSYTTTPTPCMGSSKTSVVRTFVYTVRPYSSLDTVYWSNYETNGSGCDTYQGQNGFNGYTNGCAVSFQSSDVLDGPVFSNDGFYICGSPTFLATVTSGDSYMSGDRYSENCSGSPVFKEPAPGGGDPVFHAPQEQPQSSDAVDLTSAEDVGCYIVATSSSTPVVFTLNGSTLSWSGGELENSASSPANPNSASSAVKCGVANDTTPGSSTFPATGGSSGGTTITAASGTFSSSNVGQLISGTGVPSGATIAAVTGSTQITLSSKLTANASGTYTVTGTPAVSFAALKAALFYVDGDITVSGSETGNLDLVASDSIWIDGPITYPQSDITNYGNESGLSWSDPYDSLGLIATNNIHVDHNGNGQECAVTHPSEDSCDYDQNNSTDTCGTTSSPCAIEIDAALLALTGSFEVDDYSSGGTEGSLRVFGSIAQYNRGIVALIGESGYAKDYHYDSSLHTLWPAYFIPPNGAVWSPISYAERSTGSGSEAVSGT